ncbi:MAG TPA: hypothetical protein VJ385_12185 [Fibrobacteria bacterium]|nr:hypothetical protein [Fibrobacteria bacterium]
MLPSPARPSAFRDWVKACPAPPAEPPGAAGPRAFSAAVEWDGRLFLHADARTYWTADGGRAWKSRSWVRETPKGPVPALEGGWFTATLPALYLGNRSGAIAYAFDPAGGDWTPFAMAEAAVAAGGDGERLFTYTAGRELRVSGDRGGLWSAIPLPDSIRIGTYFDELQVQGPRILLRNRDVTAVDRAASSLDGGATWMRWPAHAAVSLSQGCVTGFLRGGLDARCAAGRAFSLSDAPFGAAQKLFADGQGTLFAWADSALYACRPGDADWHWSLLASKEALRGWTFNRNFLYRVVSGTLEWFSPGTDPVSGLGGSPPRSAPVPRAALSPPAWLQVGRRPDGRAVPSLEP